MNRIPIHFIFTMGFSCESPNYLKRYDLRKMSGPFDYMYIDFHTALKVIDSNFEDYLSDIVVCNKHYQNNYLQHKKNTEKPHARFAPFITRDFVGYRTDYYWDVDLLINQNYIEEPELSGNLYDWKDICIFFHHNIVNADTRAKIHMRCQRFMNLYKKDPKNMFLFHVTKPLDPTIDTEEYVSSLIGLKKQYNISSYMVIYIILDKSEQHDDGETREVFKEDCLFLISSHTTYLNKNDGMETINRYFDIDLSSNMNEIGEFH
jgi:hypothetical protein